LLANSIHGNRRQSSLRGQDPAHQQSSQGKAGQKNRFQRAMSQSEHDGDSPAPLGSEEVPVTEPAAGFLEESRRK
jgi:hypothetical protein